MSETSAFDSLAPGSVRRTLRAEQIRLLYRNAPTGIAVNIVNGLIVSAVLWKQMPFPLIPAWMIALIVVALMRASLVWRYRGGRDADTRPQRWDVWFCIGSASAGALWGALGLMGALHLGLAHLVFVAFVVGGMALGALAVSGVFMPAFVAFLMSAATPLELGFLLKSGDIYLAMAAMGAVFVGALYLLGFNLSRNATTSIRLSLERAELIETLRAANTQAVQSNRRLAQEIRERQQAEDALRIAHEELEGKVRERTEELTLANDRLSQEVRDRQQAESALRENERRYALATAAAKVGVWDWNIQTNSFYLDPNVKALLGYQDDEIPNDLSVWTRFVHADDLPAVMSAAQAHLEARTPEYVYEHRMHHRDGTYRWIMVRGSVIRNASGKPVRMLGTDTDITERKMAEEALRVSEERFRDFAETAADWFWETDRDLRFTYLSERHQEIMGVSPGDTLGRTSEDLFADHVGDPKRWAQHVEDLRACRPFDGFEFTWTRPDGTLKVLRTSGKPIIDGSGNFQGYRGAGRDITEAYHMAQRLAHEAAHDALTGLVNRREFEQRLERAVASAKGQSASHALCYLDLDQFKLVNDTAGHVAGDTLLKQVANLLLTKVRTRDTLARLGGDEFGLLLESCPLDEAEKIVDVLLAAVRDFRFTWENRSFNIGMSVGLVPVTAESRDAIQVLSQADIACYAAKESGRNRVHTYQPEPDGLEKHHSEVVRLAELSDALEQDRFCLYCQPIVPLAPGSDKPVHYELLLRLRDAAGKLILPEAFIPAAERYGLMISVDRWVIRTACRRYSDTFAAYPDACIAINLSGNSLDDDALFDYVCQQLEDFSVPPERICFEITETTAIRNLDKASRFMKATRRHGCRFALDDFGSGLSSLTYLKHLPVDYLKIDGSFVRELDSELVDRAMVAAINQIGHSMLIPVIAECTESDAIAERLRALGVDYAQGHWVGRPRPLSAAALSKSA